MTSQGSAYGRFRRALDRGNVLEARAAGLELGELPLSDALELLLLMAERDRDRFGYAAVRWHGRYCRERRVQGDEAQAVLALLLMLTGSRAGPAAQALAVLLMRRDFERPCTLLMQFGEEPGRPDLSGVDLDKRALEILAICGPFPGRVRL